jgi:protein-tyrosine kinase
MSLVEKALQKQRAARAASPQGGAVRAGESLSPLLREPVQERRVLGDPARTLKVDREALRAMGMLPPASEARQIEHQFRSIKRPLINRAFYEAQATEGPSRRAIMVSSALPGDGKTFTSVNLALSMALERDHTVILVDGDVAKPHVSKLFGVAREPGLLDVLQDQRVDIASVLLPTDIPGLSLVPVGRQSDHATELLASARMQAVIRCLEAMDPNVIVLVDSPPILLTSEARVLASLFGQVVMVVRAGGTPRQAVLDAIQHLGEGSQVNLVLNQALHAGDGSYYSYGYGARYGEGAADEAAE